MASSLTVPSCDGSSAAYGGTAIASTMTLPGPRVVSERTIAVYSGAPVVTGMSTSAPTSLPSATAMPTGVMPTGTMSTTAMPNGGMPYGQAFGGAAFGSTAAPYPMPSLGTTAMPSIGGMWAGPQPQPPPRNLAAGLPDPSAIENQKSAYNKSLEDQLRHGEEMLKMQQKQQTDYIYQAAEAQKKQLICQIEQNAKQQEIQLSQKYSEKQMSLQQEYQHQKLILEKQANDLAMEYQRRKAQEEMMTQQYEMQKAHQEDHMRMAQQYASTAPVGSMWPGAPALGTTAAGYTVQPQPQLAGPFPSPIHAGLAGIPTPEQLAAMASPYSAATDGLAAYSPTSGSPSSASAYAAPGTAYAGYAPPMAGAPSTTYVSSSPASLGAVMTQCLGMVPPPYAASPGPGTLPPTMFVGSPTSYGEVV